MLILFCIGPDTSTQCSICALKDRRSLADKENEWGGRRTHRFGDGSWVSINFRIARGVANTLTRWVQTEMGNSSAVMFGFGQAPLALDVSCDGMIKVIDAAEKETHGGRLWSYEGKQDAW